MERLSIILNPRSGTGAARETDALRSVFAAVGAQVEIIPARGAELPDRIRAVLQTQPSVIGIAGGDGTLSSAASLLALHKGTAMLPIPLGTMNHFAQRYGVPTVEAAASAWRKQSAHAVPVGFVNDVAFINNASCGFYPHMVRHRDRLERWLPRAAANWVAGLRVLMALPVMQVELSTGTRARHLKTPALWVGLGRNSLRLPQPGDAVHEGDVLEIIAPLTTSRREIVALMSRTLFKLRQGAETPADRALEVAHAPSFTLDSPHRIDVGIDGEPYRLRPPLNFRFERDGLRVLCLVAPS